LLATAADASLFCAKGELCFADPSIVTCYWV
jgi:hypothetical protein